MSFYFLILFQINNIFAFNISSTRWNTNSAEVVFSNTMSAINSQDLNADQWQQLVKDGFDRWLNIDDVKFNISYPSYNCGDDCEVANDISEMFWLDADVEPLFLPSSALGVTLRRSISGEIIESDIVFNKNFDIVLIPGNNTSPGFCVVGGVYKKCYDFPSVATHEIGHFFGIDHTSEDANCPNDFRRTATMYYSLNPDNNSLIFLEDDDRNAMRCLYPLTGSYYLVDACCYSQNPFDRPPNCSHSFSLQSAYSLDIGSAVSGCGVIKHKNSSNYKSNNYLNIFLILLPLLFVLFFKIFVLKKNAKIQHFLFLFLFNFFVLKNLNAEVVNFKIDKNEIDMIEQNLSQKEPVKAEPKKLIVPKKKEVSKKKETIYSNEIIDKYDAIEAYKCRPFMLGIGAGFLFSSGNDISKIFDDFNNAGIDGLENIKNFSLINFQFGQEGGFDNFDIYGSAGFAFNTVKKGTGSIDYGLWPVSTNINSRLSAFPFSLTGRYRFFNKNSFRIGTALSAGFWVSRAYIELNINESNAMSIVNSQLKFGGIGYLGEIAVFFDYKLNSYFILDFNLAYSLMFNAKVKILESTGNFDKHFVVGKRLVLYDVENDARRNFKLNISGLKAMVSIKTLF